MNQKEFKDLIQIVERDTQTKCTPAFGNLSLIPKYIKMDYQRFKKMCKWICENYKAFGNRFPNIVVFEDARRQTSNYSPDTFTQYVNKEHDPKLIKEAFASVKKNLPVSETQKKKKSQKKLLMEMEKAGKVYDIHNRVWIDKKFKGSITGGVRDPEGSIEMYGIKSMNNLRG